MMRRRTSLVLVALIALVGGLAFAWRQLPSPVPAQVDARHVFDRVYPGADGSPIALAQWRGQMVVLNFWATWCAPCVDEMPELERVHRDYAARGAVVVGVGVDNATAIRAFRDNLKLTMPLLVAAVDGSQLARELGNPAAALPYTVLIDRDGRIVAARLGRIHEAELRRWLDGRLGSPAR